jgi:Lon protease-like protein
MTEIGLFPLRMVLLPTEIVPLHVFEPRYRELIAECLEHDTTFGLVYAHDGGLAQVGTHAAVTGVLERFDDGRMNIVVEGRERFRLLELTEGRSFQTARTERLESPPDDVADLAERERAIELFAGLVELTGGQAEVPDADAEQLSFLLAGRLELAPELKQELLEEASERVRLVRLVELLEAATASVEHVREVAVRAQRNGKAHPPDQA